jgi:hypothetical protein
MASAMFDKGREGFLAGNIDWDADDIRVILIDTGAYAVNLATHEFLSSVAVGARIAVSGSLSGKTVALGVADANDVTFTAVSGASIGAILVYKHTGADATARLIMWYDSGTGLPITPNGGDITVKWNASGMFKL